MDGYFCDDVVYPVWILKNLTKLPAKATAQMASGQGSLFESPTGGWVFLLVRIIMCSLIYSAGIPLDKTPLVLTPLSEHVFASS